MDKSQVVTKAQLLEQLEYMKSQVIHPEEGIFGPKSMFWKIGKYSSAFLGAGRAALLQTAHPWIANAIDQHSLTRQDPMGRFRRTFTNVFSMTFGNVDQVVDSALTVHQVHRSKVGKITEDAGAFKKGSAYFANDVNAMVWVHSTLWETSVKMYELIVGPLTSQEKEAYYQETKMFAYLFGIPENALPENWDEFIKYNEAMWESDVLTVTDEAREINRFLFSFHPLATPALSRFKVITSMMMPERLREQYGLPPETTQNIALYDNYIRWIKRVFPYLPRRLKYNSPYIEACGRLKGRNKPDLFTGLTNKAVLGKASLVSSNR